MTLFFCPACGARMVSAVERCSGGFLDRAHPTAGRGGRGVSPARRRVRLCGAAVRGRGQVPRRPSVGGGAPVSADSGQRHGRER